MHLRKGEYVFKYGEYNNAVYIVLNGVLEVSRANNGDEPIIVDVIQKGEHFNETSIFVNTPRNVSIRAQTNVDLMIFNKKELLEILRENCRLSAKLMWKIASKLGNRLSRTTGLFIDKIEKDSDVSKEIE